MNALLTVQGVSVWAGTQALVEPISLTLHPGRPVVVIGETGSGKSLFAQAILGLLPKGLRAEGQVLIDGQTLDTAAPTSFRQHWGTQVGVLPQEPWLALDPTMRAVHQVDEGYRYIRGCDRATARASARQDLDVLGLKASATKLPSQLSGGMAQRVAFAAARAGGAGIVVADEPTKGLDAARRDEVAALLMREVEQGGGLLVITHDLALARQLGGEIAVIRKGIIIERGPAEALLDAPEHDYTRRLIAADPVNWPAKGAAMMTGETVLIAEGLGKRRGGQQLFEHQDLQVRHGEIIGITGPSGCGKSTLGDILLGLVQPDSGRVRRGEGLPAIQYQKLFQDPPAVFPPRVTLGRSLADLVKRHALDAARIDPLLTRLRLAPQLLDRLPGEVSGGELQRLAVLRVLLLDPVFLFADEPTSRLDPIIQQEIIELLVEVARERGCGVLLVSHDRHLIEKTTDRQIDLRLAATASAPFPA